MFSAGLLNFIPSTNGNVKFSRCHICTFWTKYDQDSRNENISLPTLGRKNKWKKSNVKEETPRHHSKSISHTKNPDNGTDESCVVQRNLY